MTTAAILEVPRPELLLERVGGLSVLERQLFTAKRAGIDRVWVAATRPAEKILSALCFPRDLEVLWSRPDGDAARECLILSGEHFIRVEALRAVVAASRAASWADASGRNVVRTPSPQEAAPLPAGASAYLGSPLDKAAALRWLLSMGIKSQDGFMARHFDRRLSLAISRFLLDTPVTPNMMTVVSSLLGLYGATFFLEPGHATRLTGAGWSSPAATRPTWSGGRP